ncbi:MAG: integrase core domain-containing protein [candidate division WOR-3 bacterium]
MRHIRIGHRMPKHIGVIERFHCNLKEEAIYYEYPESPFEVMEIVNRYRDYYNWERPHNRFKEANRGIYWV